MANNTPWADLETGWVTLVQVFPYENATQSEAELRGSQAAADLDKTAIASILDWATAENLIEPADEPGRFRLTPMGRKSWRKSRDPV
ncbi:hypothetical protein [Allopusillimonas ginsengisoli]|uniref:hypothetical protein n=1 Tax=Allopusillimonas ginsengisoli TaxID=453575 RepID=UPI00102075EA|nr:hypothetical protein [Allopusillimonas ginsengisoli]TEA77435.1 hypothetical protein ERE07_14245 [Allopusillimonas ginsengisoli]